MIKIFLVTLAIFLVSITNVFAVTPTPTIEDTPLATDSDTIKKELQEKIKNVVDEKLKVDPQLVQTTLNTNSAIDTNRWYGFVGTVTAINQGAIDLKSLNYGPLQITTATDSAIIKDGKSIKLEQVSINDNLIAIGKLNNQGILKAKRLVAYKLTTPVVKQTIVATVSKVNTAKDTLTLTTKDNTYEVSLGKKIKEEVSDFKLNSQIVGVILVDGTKSPVLTLYKTL